MQHKQSPTAMLTSFVFAIVVLLCVGCGDDGVYRVSGKATFKGKPIPSGEIRFTPDGSKGNRGPAVLAKIKEGHYETPKDKGVVGGAYQIFISGYAAAGNAKDPTAPDFGRQLFPDEVHEVDFPKEDYEFDITIE